MIRRYVIATEDAICSLTSESGTASVRLVPGVRLVGVPAVQFARRRARLDPSPPDPRHADEPRRTA